MVIGADTSQIESAAIATRGILLSGDIFTLQALLLDQFFVRINSNVKWIILFLGGAWISLMWTLTLPLDRWIFQGLMKYRINISGQLALVNALFWSVATPIIVWGIWQILGLPFLELVSVS
ncbi:MAG: hypothetical protein HC908_08170 [Calothrix sp. SM1_7_51]|nr:hypothetical protein [Calothrix sp. SM1_7_51]